MPLISEHAWWIALACWKISPNLKSLHNYCDILELLVL